MSEISNIKNGIDPVHHTIWYNGVEYFGRVGAYSQGLMALRLEVKSSEEYKTHGNANTKPIRVTYNMGNYAGLRTPMPKNCSFLNVGEFSEIEDFVKATGLAVPVLKNGEQRCRFNDMTNEWYPVYQFDPEKLKVIDDAGYARYSKSYDKQAAYEASQKTQRETRRRSISGPSFDCKYDDVVYDNLQA